eukprot:5396819-Ditylum_brightwellii.AAC.1
MVHPHGCAGTDGTMLFHGVGNSIVGGDKHLIHLSQGVDCCLMERHKQNMHVDGDKEDGVDNSDDGGDKHLTHLSQA